MEQPVPRAVGVALAVGEPVVGEVVAGPPQRALLHRGGAEERPREPCPAVHLARAVRQMAVERDGQTEGAREVGDGPQRHQ